MTAVYAAAPPTMMPSPLQQQSNYFAQQPHQLYTPPTSSDGTPQYPSQPTSPASPRSAWPPHLHHQPQLGPRKQPMYVPAVLRRTEKPTRHSPPKAGHRTQFGSPDSLQDDHGNALQPSPVPGLSRIVTEEWNEQILGPVTGAPSRNHWKPDTATTTCDYPTCDKTFSFFERRHHCRRCGSIFCGEHSTRTIPLDHHARFHPQGTRNRACDLCFNDYRAWNGARLSRSNSTISGDSNTNGPSSATPVVRIAGAGTQPENGGIAASLAKSVPHNWNWSTF